MSREGKGEAVMTEQREGPAQVSNPREPYVHSGGVQEPGSGIELPPYADRQTSGKSEAELAAERGGPGTSEAGSRAVSQAERDGVSDTDTTAASPLGVGESIVTQGNERMVNKSADAKKAEQTDVGVGGHTKNIDPASPDVLSGDQGG
jgi:hypothetical protein